MNSLWIAVYQHSPEDTALAFGNTAAEAARLIADRFSREKVFVVGRVAAGTCYRVSDDLQDRMVARRQASGAMALTALAENQDFEGEVDPLQTASCSPNAQSTPGTRADWLIQLTSAIPGLAPVPPTYYTGAGDREASRTLDLAEAERYPTRIFAEVAARRLLGTKSCMWLAVPVPV